MRQNGFLVDLASDGDEAWELASHFPYAVIATDLRMPGMDGMMLIDQLKELQPDTVCLLVTGCSQQDWYEAPAQEAGIDVIRKPWDGSQLTRALNRALDEYRRRSHGIPESERAPAPGVRVALVGMSEPEAQRLSAFCDAEWDIVSFRTAQEASAQLDEQHVSCCLVRAAGDFGRQCRLLSAGVRRVPVVAVGDDPRGAVEAVRKGAHDWLPIAKTSAAELQRVVTLAVAKTAALSGVAVCSDLATPGMLYDRVRQATSRARRYGKRAGLLVIDLDQFASVNAAFGYEGGDALLAAVVERLRSCVRESDSLIRMGEDEFALVLEDLDSDATIEIPAQRVLNTFATPFSYRYNEVVITASIGGAVFPSQATTVEGLVSSARDALQRAKDEGSNRYRLLSEQSVRILGAAQAELQERGCAV